MSGEPSWYALAPRLGITRASMSRLSAGRDHPSDDTVLKISGIVKMDPDYLMACIHAERAKSEPVRQVWERLAEKLGGLAAALVLAVALAPFYSSDATAGAGLWAFGPTHCILC
jgi:hypothetical protein